MKGDNAMIEIRDLNIPFVDKKITMNFSKGYNLLTGDNGNGKTLLLDYISGIKKTKKDAIQGNESIIYINQNIYFSDRLTGMDFLKFSYGLDKKKDTKGFYQLSDIVIEREYVNMLLSKQWGMLSGGEKKFLYALILMSLEREWYILDEPFAFVDKKRKKLLNKIINIRVSQGKGIILTTHEEDETIQQSISEVFEI
ncbi:ATP-binding cassette domain-containing protein [Facklamia tabacinasalis]|uniref:ATP-binding cassette domain-containing protein n=2 Tax=Ruoffia tabacinasalis TaxID=87458 RepID=A0ABS0LJ72_9LACT|nr:ATP-binding cassette domain-containing protein [Ruoffia tabacinasalis]